MINRNHPNQTEDDAVARLNLARLGSLANEPSLKYLLTLSREIDQWHSRIHEAIYAHPQYGVEEKTDCICEDAEWDGECTGCVYSDHLETPGENCPSEKYGPYPTK